MKWPNLWISGTEEGKEIQVKGTENVFQKKSKDKIFPNLKKEMPIKNTQNI